MSDKVPKFLVAMQRPASAGRYVKAAFALAKRYDAELSFLWVQPRSPTTWYDVLQGQFAIDPDDAIRKANEKRLAEIIDAYEAASAVRARVVTGEPHEEIMREAALQEVDMIIIGAPDRSAGEAAFGSTTMRLLRRCPITIYILDDTIALNKKQRVLAAVARGGKGSRKMNEQILAYAKDAASRHGGGLSIIHAWRHFGEEFQRGHWGIGEEEADEVDEKLMRDHEGWLTELLRENDIDVDGTLVKGDAGEAIIDFANSNKVDLLVLGVTHRSDLANALMGTTAEDVLRRARCSVLALKPPGFEVI